MYVVKSQIYYQLISRYYADRNLMVENRIFDGKPEPLGIAAS